MSSWAEWTWVVQAVLGVVVLTVAILIWQGYDGEEEEGEQK